MLNKFDCFGQWINENSRVCNYGCGFSPDMTEEEYKEWVADGINVNEIEIDYKKLRENCEECYRRGNNG